MSLERALHQLWSVDHSLNEALSAALVFTATAPPEQPRPYAVWHRQGTRRVLHTSTGAALWETALRLAIWSDALEPARSIAAAVSQRFERRSFDLAGVRCLNMWRIRQEGELSPLGVWRIDLDFLALHETELTAVGRAAA